MSCHETAPPVTDVSTDGTATDSKALVAIPPINAEALAMVPVSQMSQKTKRSDLSQRRTRRPFSVSEVEALVEAVETLGTGRFALSFPLIDYYYSRITGVSFV